MNMRHEVPHDWIGAHLRTSLACDLTLAACMLHDVMQMALPATPGEL